MWFFRFKEGDRLIVKGVVGFRARGFASKGITTVYS